MTINPHAIGPLIRWKNKSSQERAAHAKLMTDARWKDKTPEDRLLQGKMLAAGRAKAKVKRDKLIDFANSVIESGNTAKNL
jgi:hypothetical protein